jgi:hypothetical protein
MRPAASTLLLILLVAACVQAPAVVQGRVQSVDTPGKTLVVAPDATPGARLTISLEGAEIGAEPQVGDIVRIAYRDRGGTLVATRVMNITRQAEIAGIKGH